MKLTLPFLLAIACIGICMADSDLPDMHFKFHYDNLSQKRFPLYKDGGPWRSGRKYVHTQFRKFGIRNITEQSFQSQISGQNVTGVNIIGLIEGSNKTGPIIIVGADYDTNLATNQHKDNTGGIASLLEVIHIFCDKIYWNSYHLNYTVIFVAFDLNTKEYIESKTESPGSFHFIRHWLLNYMKSVSLPGAPSRLQGAIILDSITTYNMAEKSQNLRDGFEEAMPEAYNEINSTGFKGDFLGFLYPTAEQNNSIIKTFSDNFNNNVHKSLPFRLQNMEVKISLPLLRSDVVDTINHQSHYSFWTNEDNPLPAFLLFDTDSDRVDPDMNCKLNCSVTQFLTEDRIQFMEKTTTAVWKTLMNLQTTDFEYKSSSTMNNASVMLMMIVTAISYIMFK